MAIAVEPVAPTAARPAPGGAEPARSWRPIAVAVAAVVLPFVLTAIRLWTMRRDGYVPVADHAVFEMQLRDFASHWPLVGAWSRFGWHHPGPSEAYLIGSVYYALGRDSIDIWIGAALINAAAAVAIPIVSFRRLGVLGGIASTAVFAVYVVYLGPLGMSDPWNPIIGIVPFLAFMFCLWDAWCGGRWVWVAVIATGSFAMQAHVMYALPVVALGSLTAAVALWNRRRTPPADRRAWWPVAATAGGVFAGFWALPVIEQFTARTGNMTLLFRYLTAGRGAQHTWRESLRTVTREIASPVESLVRGVNMNVSADWPYPARWLTIAGSLLVVAGLITAIRLRRRELIAPYVLGLVGAALATAQCTRMEKELWAYLTAWISAFFVIFGVAVVATAIVAARTWGRAPSVSPRVQRAVGAASLAVLAAVMGAVALLKPWKPSNSQVMVQPLLADIAGRIPKNGPVLLTDGELPLIFEVTTVADAFVRAGVDVRMPNKHAILFGDRRVIHDDAPVMTLQVFVVPPGDPYPEIPGYTPYARGGKIALYTPTS